MMGGSTFKKSNKPGHEQSAVHGTANGLGLKNDTV